MKRKLVLMTSALMAITLLAGCENKHTHEWGEATYTWASDYSTCTALRVCKGDESHKETETANSTYSVVTEAKCEEDGKGRYSVSFKNEAFAAQTKEVKIDALTHDYQFAEFVWTEFTAQAKYVCSHDASHVQLHDATVTNEVTTQPGCETEGVKTYTASYDGHTGTKTEVIPANKHSWGAPTYNWSNDYSSCTATRVCENDPNHKESETVNSTSVETQASYVVEGSITYTATFTNAAFSTQTYYQKTSDKLPYHGEVPLLSEDGKTLTYGLYPQTNVNDEALLTALNLLPETDGYYFYENAYYAKVSATPFLDNYKFDNGTTIVEGTTYWFKCEPISWTILTNDYVDADEHHLGYYLLSSVLLDAHRYDDDSSNYANSEIRSFLINDFYNSAFTLNNTYIQTTTVDNSASTTNSDDNPYVCDNTQDKVFLPSYKDYINSNYGFLDSEDETETRYCKTTDWARARGGEYSTNECYYWTRSPDDRFDDPKYASYVRWGGELSGNYVPRTYTCVRPAISIKIA